MFVLFGALFLLIGLFFGIFIGAKMGVDSCEETMNENVVFRHILENTIKIKNDKKLKENERKRMMYENLETLNRFMNKEINL
jgi:hypothetical protein